MSTKGTHSPMANFFPVLYRLKNSHFRVKNSKLRLKKGLKITKCEEKFSKLFFQDDQNIDHGVSDPLTIHKKNTVRDADGIINPKNKFWIKSGTSLR